MLDEKGLISLFYCDDLAIVGSKSNLITAKKIIDEFYAMTKFEILNKKSAVVKLSRKNKKLDDERFWDPLPHQEEYKYLGTVITRSNNLNSQLRKTLRKVFMILNRLKILSKDISLNKKCLLLKSLVMPDADMLGPIALLFGGKQKKVGVGKECGN